MIAVPLIVSSLFALASGLQQPASVNRRSFFAAPLVPAAWGLARQPAFAKGPSLAETKSFVKEARDSLDPLPDLLQKESWDTVRTVLKIKCGKLWNLGEAQNPIVQFAKGSGESELFEMAEELSTDLQLADQFTYDNVFIYFQPGAGKVNIKEPTKQVTNC